MRVDPEPTLKGAERTLNTFGIHALVRQDEVMPTPYERPVLPAEGGPSSFVSVSTGRSLRVIR